MSRVTPDREWWSAAEIAEAGLPDLPGTARSIQRIADRLSWTSDPTRARRRAGKGGGWEYHWTLFPSRAQQLLIARVAPPPVPTAPKSRDEAWAWFDTLPQTAKDKAASRLATIQKVEAFERGGLTRDQSVRDVAQIDGCAPRSIWNWLDMIVGVRRDDRLPYLAPRHRAAPRPTRATPVDPEFAALFKSDYLRPSQPTLSSCYDRACRAAERRAIPTVPVHTVRRWLKANVSDITILLARKGYDYVKAMYPPQVRDKSAMHALEAVNGDFHRFDVFVRWPRADGRGDEIIRPQMVAFQDVYSGRLLAWRVDRTPNAHAVQMCIGDLIADWGVPTHVLLDNGREFAAKAITGGASTRYRFKVKEDDVPGILTTLGCKIHWATPYSGQSKPIERAFRDLADRVSRHPAFEGAYTGNAVDAKPENYGSRAVPLDQFLTVLSEEIEHHNTRQGRRSEVAWGRSFAEVFAESYATAPISKATAEQRRLCLMGAEGIRANPKNGFMMFQGNRYFADWMHSVRGQKLVARFDTANLHDGLHVYAMTGEYLGHAPCVDKSGFFDVDEGRAHAALRKRWMNAERARLEAAVDLTPAAYAAELAAHAAAAARAEGQTPVQAKVVRLVRPDIAPHRPADPAPDPRLAAAQQAVIADLAARRDAQPTRPEDGRDAYLRWLDLEARLAAGEELTREQRRWFASYPDTAEYRTWKGMVEDFGSDVLTK